MAQQALHDAQARLTQLQKQYDAAFCALEAEPYSDLKLEHYQQMKISLNKTEDAVNSLAAALSTSGGDALTVTNRCAYCCTKQHRVS